MDLHKPPACTNSFPSWGGVLGTCFLEGKSARFFFSLRAATFFPDTHKLSGANGWLEMITRPERMDKDTYH